MERKLKCEGEKQSKIRRDQKEQSMVEISLRSQKCDQLLWGRMRLLTAAMQVLEGPLSRLVSTNKSLVHIKYIFKLQLTGNKIQSSTVCHENPKYTNTRGHHEQDG